MRVGDVFTIEPIIVAAPDYELFELDDDWTIGVESGAKCAMFEHSVMVTENGCEVLTQQLESHQV
jgi:methionyl aminopeptidase